MPFKLKLKKSRHYSVVSKSLFVISVEMLDATNIECTLSSESTGQDCLDIVCQKLGLTESRFFGLQYMSKNSENSFYWIELDRPIKRQLDKYARSLCVYLRVMYYITSGVQLLSDEVTRYHFFLQLKMDVIEGKISCTPQQAIELASYSMQAEFGNYDAERHTSHYLKDFQLFPKSFSDSSLLESLTDAASRQHAALQNLPQGIAEEYYICACQKLEGYGQEIYAVKDHFGDDAIISVSLTELFVGYTGEHVGSHYRWMDIKNVINHKKDFIIETTDSEKVGFQFPDTESAKNAWRFCVLQHTFYRQYEMNSKQSDEDLPSASTVFQQPQIEVENYEDVTDSSYHWDGSTSVQTIKQLAPSVSCLELNKPGNKDYLKSLLPSYRPAPDYETAIQHKYRNSSSAISSTEPLRNTHTVLYSSQPEIHHSDTYSTHLCYPDIIHSNVEAKNILTSMYKINLTQSQVLSRDNQNSSENIGFLHLYKPPPPYPSHKMSSNSTPDLAGISQQQKPGCYFSNNIVSGSSPDLVSGTKLYLKHYDQALYSSHQPHSIHKNNVPPQQSAYENLTSILGNRILRTPHAFIVDNRDVTKHIKKVYDEHGNIIYCMPGNMKQILQENEVPAAEGYVVVRNQNMTTHNFNNPTEPIYENIPLQCHTEEKEEMRTRTQSVHSAPEFSQKVNFNLSTLQAQFQQDMNLGNNKASKESLYANVNRNMSTFKLTEADIKIQNTCDQTVSDSPVIASYNDTTFENKNSVADKDSTLFEENVAGDSKTTKSISISRSSKSKKKRWGILTGKSKSNEKVKSATLGRENDTIEKNHNTNKHRWSTGLPRFNPLPPSISKETMCQLLESKLADSQLFFEFDNIPKKKQNADYTTALDKDNASFNRFKDVLPYEDNRLRLTPTKNNKFGYVNASHITATVGSKQRFYIAAQGPNQLTLPYFWQCIWEAEVYLVVQLTDVTEGIDYMPDAEERCVDISDEYQVWWEFSQESGNCVTSKVRLCHVMSRRYRTLWHLHYNSWDEQGCPLSVSHFLGFLEEMQSVQHHAMTEIPPGHNKNPPILLHCTAGVGRTGLTILSDLLLYTVDHNQEVCIPRVVELLRYQRAYMVQTIAQYKFVYSLLVYYLKQTRLI